MNKNQTPTKLSDGSILNLIFLNNCFIASRMCKLENVEIKMNSAVALYIMDIYI